MQTNKKFHDILRYSYDKGQPKHQLNLQCDNSILKHFMQKVECFQCVDLMERSFSPIIDEHKTLTKQTSVNS